MEYGPDIMCPQCGARHGAAAKNCDCGHVFTTPEEEPAPAWHFFSVALFFGAVAFISAWVMDQRERIYLPVGALLFMGVATALGVRSLIFSYAKKRQDEKKD